MARGAWPAAVHRVAELDMTEQLMASVLTLGVKRNMGKLSSNRARNKASSPMTLDL